MACGRFSGDLSGFVDGTLPPTRWEQVGYHVAGCQECRDQVADLRAVRDRLRDGQREPSCNPTLAARLEGIAGEGCHAPLYMTRCGSTQLPSRRAGHRRQLWAAGAVAVAGAFSVLGSALLLAPDPPRIASPVKQARHHYSLSLTAINVNAPVGAVLLAHDGGAELSEPTTLTPRSMHVTRPRPISARQAEALLSRQALTFSGIQRVWVADGEGRFHTTDVQMDEVADVGVRLVVLDSRGNRFKSWFVPGEGCCHQRDVPTDWTFLQYEGHDEVAEHPGTVIEARGQDNRRVARWWVDESTGLVLWSERYDAAGNLSVVTGFTEVQLGTANVDPGGAELVVMNSSPTGAPEQWCVGLLVCPEEVGGLPLVAHSSSDSAGVKSMNLVYSDGFRNLTVTWNEGRLDQHLGTRMVDDAPGQPHVSVWQAGDGVITVTTNAGVAMVDRAQQQLPEQRPFDDSFLERCRKGLGRLLGSN